MSLLVVRELVRVLANFVLLALDWDTSVGPCPVPICPGHDVFVEERTSSYSLSFSVNVTDVEPKLIVLRIFELSDFWLVPIVVSREFDGRGIGLEHVNGDSVTSVDCPRIRWASLLVRAHITVLFWF